MSGDVAQGHRPSPSSPITAPFGSSEASSCTGPTGWSSAMRLVQPCHTQGQVQASLVHARCRVRRAGNHPGDAMIGKTGFPAEDEEISRLQLDIGPRLVAIPGVAEAEGAGV